MQLLVKHIDVKWEISFSKGKSKVSTRLLYLLSLTVECIKWCDHHTSAHTCSLFLHPSSGQNHTSQRSSSTAVQAPLYAVSAVSLVFSWLAFSSTSLLWCSSSFFFLAWRWRASQAKCIKWQLGSLALAVLLLAMTVVVVVVMVMMVVRR